MEPFNISQNLAIACFLMESIQKTGNCKIQKKFGGSGLASMFL